MNQSQNRQSANASQSAQSQDEGKNFFNLHVSGIGYLSRVRFVDGGKKKSGGSTRRGDSFLCCAINALHGSVDDPNYSYFDLKVSGEEATALIQQLQEHVDANRKVLVAFKVGDVYAHAYERKVRDAQGQQTGRTEVAALIKGRLLLITMAKVDGEIVYQREEVGAEGKADGDGQEAKPSVPDDELPPVDDDSQEPPRRQGSQRDRSMPPRQDRFNGRGQGAPARH